MATKLTPAQEKIANLIRRNGSAKVGQLTNEEAGTVHAPATEALARRGIVSISEDRFARLIETEAPTSNVPSTSAGDDEGLADWATGTPPATGIGSGESEAPTAVPEPLAKVAPEPVPATSEFGYHKDGRRFVIDGDTRCAPKGSLGKFGIGLNFDWDSKVWWTAKEDRAQQAVFSLAKWSHEKAAFACYVKRGEHFAIKVPLSVLSPDEKVPGQTVAVRKKSGETKTETLGEVLEWVEREHVICLIKRAPRKARGSGNRKSRYGEGRCKECGTPLETWHDGYHFGLCHDCI